MRSLLPLLLLLCTPAVSKSPRPKLLLIPDMVVYVCPDSPVTEKEVAQAIAMWNYPTPIRVAPGSEKQCSSPPGLSETYIHLFDEKYLTEDEPPDVYALTVCNYMTLFNNVGLFTDCTILMPPGADQWTLVHEIGHLTGRMHVNDQKNVMYPERTDVTKYLEPWTQEEYESIWQQAAQ